MKLNNLVKRVIGAVAAVFGLLFLVAGKNLKIFAKINGKSFGEAGKAKVFDFLTGDIAKAYKEMEWFGVHRVLLWVAIIVIFAALAWFVFAVVAELVKNEKLTKIANKFSKWAAVALASAVVLLLIVGIIPHTEKEAGSTLKVTASVFSSVWFYLTAVCAVGSAVVEFKA